MIEAPRAEELPTDPDRADLSDPMTALFQRTFRGTHDLEAESMEARILGDLLGLEVECPKVGRFEVYGRLGGGGMGEVYLAWDPELRRKVAIKLMHRRRNADPDELRREARALAQVDSPRHVVPIYDSGVHGDRGYLVMKNIEGRTLAQWQRERRSLREIISVYAQAALGLAEMHRMGVVHCDFKPSNVLVDASDQVWVADFGLARLVVDDDDSTGGTRGYMAPEQIFEGVNSPASDQFSFCIALFSAIHGVSPFPGNAATLGQRLARCEVVVPAATRKIPGWLTRLLERGLRRDPSQRFSSMETLREELVRDHGKAVRRGAGAIAVAAAIGLTLSLLPRPDPLAGVWDDERRIRLEQRFADLDDDSGRVVVRIFEEWAGKWRVEWQQAEVGSSVVSDDDAMSDCLADHRAQVEELVNELLETGPDQLWAAPRDLNELPDPVLCRHATRARPVDPETAEALNARLARAKVARLALDFEGSLAIASDLLHEARDWPAMQIDALHQSGLAWSAAGEPRPALADLNKALDLAIEQNERGRIAELYIDLVWAADAMIGPELQLEWLDKARAHQRNLVDPALEARIPLAEALIYLDLGRPGWAETYSRSNLDAMELRGTSGTLHELESRHVLAMALTNQDRMDEAEAEYQIALGRADEILGPSSPQKEKLLSDAGRLALNMGNPTLAQQRLEQALQLRLDSLPPDHPFLARSYLALAWLELELGNHHGVEANVHEAMKVGIERSREYEAYLILGLVHANRHHWSAAVDWYDRAVEAVPGLEIELAQIGLLSAEAHAKLGDRRTATINFDRFLPKVEDQHRFPLPDDSLCPIWALRIQALDDETRAREEMARVRKLIGNPENCPTLIEVVPD